MSDWTESIEVNVYGYDRVVIRTESEVAYCCGSYTLTPNEAEEMAKVLKEAAKVAREPEAEAYEDDLLRAAGYRPKWDKNR